MKNAVELSIVMINYNKKELTAQAVQSIFDCELQISFEIIVVDNSSDSLQRYDYKHEYGTVITCVENKGFGNACNIGAKYSCGMYILFLNNDTIMHQGTLEACVLYLRQHPQVGVIGTRTLLEDGTLDHACKRGFPTPTSSVYYFLGMDKEYPKCKKYGAYRMTWVNENSVSEVDSVSGSFLMMPRYLFDRLNGYDETFFMYGEDLDLCYRVKDLGFSVIYYGQASITHLKGQSGLHTKSQMVKFYFYDSMLIFYKKHYQHQYSLFTTVLVYNGIKIKYAIDIIKIKLGKL